jgi:pimeloyl-ACP methyl ester carboxylesterase
MIWLLSAVLCLGALLFLPALQETLRRPLTESMRRNAPGKFAELSQGQTHYRWIGPLRGPVVVCVHGITTPSESFLPLAQELAEMGYRVLLYDLYGRGYSDYVPGLQDRAFLLQQLDDLLAYEGIVEDFVLVGHSAGGAIATAFAAANIWRVRSLILVTTVGLHKPRTPMAEFRKHAHGIQDLILRWSYPIVARRYVKGVFSDRRTPDAVRQAQQAQLSRRGYMPSNLAAIRGILRDDFAEEQKLFNRQGLPVLAIWARDDVIIPPQTSGRLAELNRSAKQEVVEDAGHEVVYTHAEDVARLIAENQRRGL